MQQSRYLTAREVAETLGVSLATVYSYVSRGLIRSEATGENNRKRRYLAEDVEKLSERKMYRRDPAKIAEHAMHWGMPVLESALTSISETGLFYRGQDALQLATTATIEEVAALLWAGDRGNAATIFAAKSAPALARPHQWLQTLDALDASLSPIQRAAIALTLSSVDDLAAYDLENVDSAIQVGARILRVMAVTLAGMETSAATWLTKPGISLAEILQRNWQLPADTARLLDAMLILCADHELNTSTFAARVVASSGAHLYLAVSAGLAALQGIRHGGSTLLVEGLLREVGEPQHVRRVLAQRLQRGQAIPGFGHRLYPDGDPRGKLLLRLAAETYPDSLSVALAQRLAETMQEETGRQPTLELALVTLANALGLPEGSALSLFALGRTVGWIGHALEQYQSGQMIRPRATYAGV